MKNLKIVLIAVASVVLFGCNSNRVFEKHKKGFKDYQWESSKIIEFSPVIEDIEAEYDVYFALRHIYGFQFRELNIMIEMTTPSGKIMERQFIIPVYTHDKKLISDCAGDYCDLESLIEENFKFDEKGQYKFTIEHIMEADPIPNVVYIKLKLPTISIEKYPP